jgi:exoribonuclease-2
VEGKLVHGADGLDVGDRVQVKLIATDVERGYIDFARVVGSPAMGVRSRATR